MENIKNLLTDQKPILLAFYADWCGSCQTVLPILEDIQKEFSDKIEFLKIDADKNQEITKKYKIRSVPTLLLFKGKEIEWKAAGLQSRAAIRKQLQKVLHS